MLHQTVDSNAAGLDRGRCRAFRDRMATSASSAPGDLILTNHFRIADGKTDELYVVRLAVAP